MFFQRSKRNKAFSLMELVLAIAIFAIGSIVAGNLMIDANTATRIDLDKAQAVLIAREGIEAVTSIRDANFAYLSTSTWPHGLESGGGGFGWAFSTATSTVVEAKFYRSIYITLNPTSDFTSTSTAIATSTVTWENARGVSDSVSLTTVLTNWRQANP